jgi:DNA repair protein SbcC/Rad50
VTDLAAIEAELKDAREAVLEAKRMAKDAAAELKASTVVQKAAAKAFAESDAVRQRIERLMVELRGKTEQRTHAEEQWAALAERAEQIREAIAELPAIEEELSRLEGVEDRLRAAIGLAGKAAELATIRHQLEGTEALDISATLSALEAAAAELEGARATAAAAEAERAHRASLLEVANRRLERAAEADPTQPCPTCGRPLEDFASYLKHCRAEVSSAKKAATAATTAARRALAERGKAEKAHASAAREGERIRGEDARRAQLAERADALEAEVEALAEPFDGRVPDVDELRADAERARTLGVRAAELGAQRRHLAQVEQDLASTEKRLAALDRDLAALTGEAEGLAFDEAEHDRLRKEAETASGALEDARAAEREASDARKDAEKQEASLAASLRQAKETQAKVEELRSQARYVERVAMLLEGFRNHLVARIGPELSREAEALFRELTNHEYDDLMVDEDTLTIRIADGDTYFPIDRFSGSETDLANLALRVAISTQLSRLSGADVGMMVLDEVLGSLDQERKDLMVQTLGRVSTRFHQLFVVTHAEQVKDQFPATILVQKTGRRRSTAVVV